jgi:hypothetical protein
MLFGSDSNPDGIGWNSRNALLKWPMRILGVLSAILVIVSQVSSSSTLSSVGKCLFWVATSLLSVLVLNRDLYRDIWAWIISFLLVGLQLYFIKLAWGVIGSWNFIEIAAASFAQAILFFCPYLVLRRHRELSYPPKQEESK